MKFYFFIFCLFLLPNTYFGQFVDDFQDGDFTNNPTWLEDVSDFEIDGSNRLHLNAPSVSSISNLSTSSTAINDATWEFTVQLDFNPTSSNYAQIYLVASSSDLESDMEGYFVRIGNSTKEVSLYRQDGLGDVEEIIDGVDDVVDVDPVAIRVKVTRTADGNWELLRDVSAGSNYISEGVIADNTYEASQFFGVYCKYTSTRSDKFYFSDFVVSGTAFIDVEAPVIESHTVLDQSRLQIVFSETMSEPTVSQLINFEVDGGVGVPSMIEVVSGQEIVLNFSNSFIDGLTYQLIYQSLTDLSGNPLDGSLEFIYYTISDPLVGDVIINEIMADPTPAVGLPVLEYLEIFNRSDNSFDLSDWVLVNTTTAKTIGGILPANEYMILCDEDDLSVFSSFGNVYGIPSFTALANSQDSLTLVSSDNIVMDVVSYSDEWYNVIPSSDGGRSLERVNPFLVCSGIDNWHESESNIGGTPGTINSVFDDSPDLNPINLVEVYVNSETELVLMFDELLLEEDIDDAVISINNGISVSNVQYNGGNTISIEMNPSIQLGIEYEIIVVGLEDCAGNAIQNNQLSFGLPQSFERGDVVINEILNNPITGGSDFIEIVNISDKYINLSDFKLARIDNGSIVDHSPLTARNKVLAPGGYLVVTESKQSVLESYPNSVSENILIVPSIPSYNDSEGTVIGLNGFNQVVDSVHYTSDFHFGLLDDLDGVSLERISFDGDSNDPNNWHSAAQSVGFASPGYINSQQVISNSQFNSMYNIETSILSPDNDGFQDVLLVSYQLDKPGYLLNISILNNNGQFMYKLADNQLLGVQGTVSWDGLFENNQKAPIGMYVFVLEFFDLQGNVKLFKEVVVVAGDL